MGALGIHADDKTLSLKEVLNPTVRDARYMQLAIVLNRVAGVREQPCELDGREFGTRLQREIDLDAIGRFLA